MNKATSYTAERVRERWPNGEILGFSGRERECQKEMTGRREGERNDKKERGSRRRIAVIWGGFFLHCNDLGVSTAERGKKMVRQMDKESQHYCCHNRNPCWSGQWGRAGRWDRVLAWRHLLIWGWGLNEIWRSFHIEMRRPKSWGGAGLGPNWCVAIMWPMSL